MRTITLWQLILVLPWAGAAALAALPQRWDRFARHAAAAVAAVLTGLSAWAVLAGPPGPGAQTIAQIGLGGPAHLALIFRVDGLSELFALVTTSVYLLVTIYAAGYLPHAMDEHGSPDEQRAFHAIMAGFAGAMLGLVTSENLLQMYVFWELTSVASFLLIGFWSTEADARDGAVRVLVMTFIGGLFLLAGLLLVGADLGSLDFRAILASSEQGKWLGIAAALVAIGAASKCAQFPFTSWLPAAMTAPTPVSAFLHSASLVAAGVFVLCRFFPLLSQEAPWFWSLSIASGVSVGAAGVWALRQETFKGLLAYSTIGQYAYMLVGLAVGTATALAASLYAFLLHAAIKAGLFLVAGAVTHETGAKAFSELDHTARPSRPLAVMAAALVFALSGVPLAAAFHYKEKLLHAADEAAAWPLVGVLLVGAGVTAAYSLRFFLEIFVRGRRDPRALHPAPWSMLAPTGVLALVALLATFRPGWASGFVTRAARGASGGTVSFQVSHELGALTWTSVAVVLGGLAAYVALRRRTHLRAVARRLPGDLRLGGRRIVKLYGDLSERVLDLHDGNLRHYLRVILLSLVALFGLFAFAWEKFPLAPITDVDPVLVGGLIASIAPAAIVVMTTNYVVMVIALNVTGYAMAVVFLHMHAPNVAIAQVLVETLAPLIFVMALRQTHGTTPETQSHRLRPKHDPWRWPTSIGLGLAIGLVTYITREGGRSDSVGSWYATHGEDAGGPRDHVAAILADFRALDTVMEALVFAVAMLGVVGLYHGMKAAR